MFKYLVPLIFISIFLAQPVLSQKYFNTNQFQNIPYYTEPQDLYFDSSTNSYLACFSSRSFADNNYLTPYNTLLLYDTSGNILNQRVWDPFIHDTILKIEIISKYRDSVILIGNMKVNDSNYLFFCNTDTSLLVTNLKFVEFPHNDSNFVYYCRFDTTNSNYNYIFFNRTYHYSNPVGLFTTPFVLKLNKINNTPIQLYQIHKDTFVPSAGSVTYAYSLAEFSNNDSTFKVAFNSKYDSLTQGGLPQSSNQSSFDVRISNLDTSFIYDQQNDIKVWDSTHFKSNYYSLVSDWIPAFMPIDNYNYIFCSQMIFGSTLWTPSNYYIGLYKVDRIADTVLMWKRFPAYPGNPYDSLSAMHILSKRNSLTRIDNNHFYLVGSEGKDGEAVFIHSLDSSFNIRWSRYIKKDSIKRFIVESVSLNHRGELLIASYGDVDSSNFDYPVLLKIDSSGNFSTPVKDYQNNYSGITFYPNPSQNQIYIKSSVDLLASNISIFSLDGKLLSCSKLNSSDTTLDVSNLVSGFYMFEIVKNGKNIFSARFVKQ